MLDGRNITTGDSSIERLSLNRRGGVGKTFLRNLHHAYVTLFSTPCLRATKSGSSTGNLSEKEEGEPLVRSILQENRRFSHHASSPRTGGTSPHAQQVGDDSEQTQDSP